ncbi:hypothetical protein Hanom_Chr04g00326101 [Helianthus anomalus]
MASACLNRIGISPDNMLECSQKYSSYSWFTHRLSISREEDVSKSKSKSKTKCASSPKKNRSDVSELSDTDARREEQVKKLSDLTKDEDPNEFDGFEFRLDGSVMMLPADELFSDGKLVPLQLSVVNQPATSSTEIVSGDTDTLCSRRRSTDDAFAADPYLFSPRAPRCSSRWKELLGFRKLHQNSNNVVNKVDSNKAAGVNRSSIRQLLNRSSRSSSDSFINLPLLKETDSESVSVSSRPSLSSSSSGHEMDDLPRLSLDSDRPNKLSLNFNTRPKTRLVKTKLQSTIQQRQTTARASRSTSRRSSESTVRGVSVDSPRMNSSGKIVFHSLERSSSSPSSFNGGPRFKHRGMERSYSANVRVTPVLNVPVCSKSGSVFGFPIFSSQQKQRELSSSNNGGSVRNR